MPSFFRPLLISCCLSALSLPALAAEAFVAVKPGEYEISNNMVSATTKQCFRSDKISAASMIEQMNLDQGSKNRCEILDSRKNGESLEIDLACKHQEGIASTGQMNISSQGEAIRIKTQFSIMVEGQKRTMDMTSEGKRIGGC